MSKERNNFLPGLSKVPKKIIKVSEKKHKREKTKVRVEKSAQNRRTQSEQPGRRGESSFSLFRDGFGVDSRHATHSLSHAQESLQFFLNLIVIHRFMC